MAINQANDNHEYTVSHDNLPGSSTDARIDNNEIKVDKIQNNQEIISNELVTNNPESSVYDTSNLSREPREIVKFQGTNTKKNIVEKNTRTLCFTFTSCKMVSFLC